jgi:hypothetical protein
MVKSNESSTSETTSITLELDYPSGIRLVVIIVALVLTMFMVALDMVSKLESWRFKY